MSKGFKRYPFCSLSNSNLAKQQLGGPGQAWQQYSCKAVWYINRGKEQSQEKETSYNESRLQISWRQFKPTLIQVKRERLSQYLRR